MECRVFLHTTLFVRISLDLMMMMMGCTLHKNSTQSNLWYACTLPCPAMCLYFLSVLCVMVRPVSQLKIGPSGNDVG